MSNPFFEHPILNSPYERPPRHWELDDQGQPTQRVVEPRRRAEFITPIPKPRKRKRGVAQEQIVFDEGKGLSTKEQQYEAEHITREPEQVKAFRDTWRDGIHSYLTCLRDRLTVARDLLTDSGSVFVQIGDENVHRVRAVMDEVFGPDNLCAQITVVKTAGQTAELIAGTADYVLWFSKKRETTKVRNPLLAKGFEADKSGVYRWVRQADG